MDKVDTSPEAVERHAHAIEYGEDNSRDYTATMLRALSARAEAAEAALRETALLAGRCLNERLTAEARVRVLEEALRPFDACSFFLSDDPDDRVISIGRWSGEHFYADVRLTVADFRRARTALGGQSHD